MTRHDSHHGGAGRIAVVRALGYEWEAGQHCEPLGGTPFRWPAHTGRGNLRLWSRYFGLLLVLVRLVVLRGSGLAVRHWRKKWCRTSAPSSVRWKVIRR